MASAAAEVTHRSVGPRQYGYMFGVAGGVVLVDQITKWWAVNDLVDGPIHVVWTLNFTLAYNTGAAFSSAQAFGPLIGILAIALVAGLVWVGRAIDNRLGAVSLGLVLGGAVGNLLDRIFREGEGFLGGPVVDFIDLEWWPIFNVADMSIVIGGIMLLLFGLRGEVRS